MDMEIMGYGETNNNTLIFSNQSIDKTFGREIDFITKIKVKK